LIFEKLGEIMQSIKWSTFRSALINTGFELVDERPVSRGDDHPIYMICGDRKRSLLLYALSSSAHNQEWVRDVYAFGFVDQRRCPRNIAESVFRTTASYSSLHEPFVEITLYLTSLEQLGLLLFIEQHMPFIPWPRQHHMAQGTITGSNLANWPTFYNTMPFWVQQFIQ
jgi:hypothetical protein